MAINNRSPWWCSAILGVGLIFIFAGERAFKHLETGRTALTGIGLALVVISTLMRFFAWGKANGRQRSVEWISIICHLGIGLALLGYYATTDSGMAMFGMDTESAKERFGTSMTVLWVIVLFASFIPLMMIETVLGTSNRSSFSSKTAQAEESVDIFRVRDMASSGLTIAFAMAFLMVTCNIAEQRNIRKDVSFFKTSSPGGATVAMVEATTEPMTALLFFPQVDEVADEVEGYFQELSRKSNKLTVQRVDRLVDAEIAKDHKVNQDGTIILVRGEKPEAPAEGEKEKKTEPPTSKYKTEKFTVSTDAKKAKASDLRKLDETVQKSLMKVIRDKRIAYMSVGHGELNDPDSIGAMDIPNPLAKATILKQVMTALNYEVKNWSGFGKPVPDDATLLMVIAPRKALLTEDIRAIGDYLGRGGRLMMALDPESEALLGDLEGRLGLSFDKTMLADDKEHFVQSQSPADNLLIATNQYSSHSSVTTLSRAGDRARLLMVRAGSFTEVPFTKKAGSEDPKRTFVVRSMVSSFKDTNANFSYDKGDESRARYNLAAAVEDSAAVPDKVKEGEKHDGMRAFLIADGELFSDGIFAQIPAVQALVVDAIKWLGGEEEFMGDTKNEEDIRIEHTKSEDANWFWLTLAGAPALVLLLGLGLVAIRNRMIVRRAKR